VASNEWGIGKGRDCDYNIANISVIICDADIL